MQIQLNEQTANQAQLIFQSLGLDITTAINIFLEQSIQAKNIPFQIVENIPNEDTIEAIKEVEHMKKNPSISKSYTDVDTMIQELLQ
ncbi:MAG: damage-inducible protein J [Epulopiscium sp. Nele67-Bin004]|nr:MAG: damage-inducible protein J [Epulopiscium sp. Nele67-Bin004]